MSWVAWSVWHQQAAFTAAFTLAGAEGKPAQLGAALKPTVTYLGLPRPRHRTGDAGRTSARCPGRADLLDSWRRGHTARRAELPPGDRQPVQPGTAPVGLQLFGWLSRMTSPFRVRTPDALKMPPPSPARLWAMEFSSSVVVPSPAGPPAW